VAPMLVRPRGQLDEAFDEEHAGVADLAVPLLAQVEAPLEDGLVALAVRKARTEMRKKIDHF